MDKATLRRRALEEVRNRRQHAITLAEEHRQVAYDKLPRLLTLENTAISTGLAIARMGAAGIAGAAIKEKQNMLREIEAQRRDLLTQAGFAPDFLQPQFTCRICGDTGLHEGHTCNCVTELMHQLRRQELGGVSPLSSCNFENFSLDYYSDQPNPEFGFSPRENMRSILPQCVDYAQHFSADCPSLFFAGDAGLGKTHLALAIANRVLNAGFDVLYLSSQTAFAAIDRDRYTGGGETLQAMLEAELLILDDLGTEFLTPFVSSCLYRIVDTRLCRKLPTIYTSNIRSQQTLNSRYTEKVASRLLGSCTLVHFFGDDIRLLKTATQR